MAIFDSALDHTGTNNLPVKLYGKVQVYMSLDKLRKQAIKMGELIDLLVRDGEGSFTGEYKVPGQEPRPVSPSHFTTLCAMAAAIGLLVRSDADSVFLAYKVPQFI